MNLVTGADLAKEISEDFNRAAVTMARNRGKIIQDENGLYDIDHPDTAAWILKQLHNISKKKHHDLETPKAPKPKAKPKRKTVPKKSVEKKKIKKEEVEILSEVEIFISALSSALEDSDISSKNQNNLKKAMIEKSEQLELGQSESPFDLENKPYKNKIITDTTTIKKYEKSLFPKKGNHVFFVTTSAMNASAFLLFAAKNIGKIEELYMSYFRISKFSVNILRDLIAGNHVKKCYVLISELSTRDASSSKDTLDGLIEDYPGRVAGGTVQTHTKIMSMKIRSDYFTISSSANITMNARVEQYSVFNDKELFEYNKDWILSPEKYLNQKDSVHFGDIEIFK